MAGEIVKNNFNTGGRIAPIVPQTFDEVFRVARVLVASGLVPKEMNDETKVVTAIMKGLELGVPPIQAVQSIAVINGRPCVWGDLSLALVQRSEFCEEIREWLEGDGDDRVAHCEARRAGRSSAVKRSFSVKQARQAGLWQTDHRVKTKWQQKDGSYEKDNDSPWYRYPERMLQMRARALCLRDTFPDVLAGIAIREEEEDLERSMKDVTPAAPSENPLIDPPLDEAYSTTVIDEAQQDAGGLMLDEQGFLNDEQNAGEPDASEGQPETLDGAGQQDEGPKVEPTFALAGMVLTPPSADFSTTDFLTYLGELISATTLEGAMGANAKVKALAAGLPDTDKPLYQIAAGYKLSIVKGTSSDPAGEGLIRLKEWAMADFGRTA